ncbi:hypothetical protein [Streptomyces sp. NPDC051567]|uniref:hypothetical protein n=1 Tax=Streptomyces sp. NPDC051567 TaxID=3365660 RepID=UPI0037A82EBB
MTSTTTQSTSSRQEQASADQARRRAESLVTDLRQGTWTATPLEQRVAAVLVTATAADGLLTAGRVRAALWEGDLTMTYENGGRFAHALADLVPILDDPTLSVPDVIALTEMAAELVAAVAGLG